MMASKGKKRKGLFNSSQSRKKKKVSKSTSTTANKPSECSISMIPPGYPNDVIIRLTRLKICANCNTFLSDDNNFPFTGCMSYINTCTVAEAFSIVYPENWKDLDKINIEDKYLCIECISALNKIYKTYIKFNGLLSVFKKSPKSNDNEVIEIDDDNTPASPVSVSPESDSGDIQLLSNHEDDQDMYEADSDFNSKKYPVKTEIKSEDRKYKLDKQEVDPESQNSKNKYPYYVFVCPKCSSCIFRSKTRAIGHMEVCGVEYPKIDKLEKLDYIYCKYSNCLKSFKTTAIYKEHLNEAHKLNFDKLNCGICATACKKKRYFIQHFQAEHPSYEKALIFDTETCERMMIRIKSKDESPIRNSTSNSNKQKTPDSSPNKSRPKRQSANYSLSKVSSSLSYSSEDNYSDDSFDDKDKEFRIKSYQRNGVTSSSSDSDQTENNSFTCTICNLSMLKSREDLQSHRKLCQVLEEKSKLMDIKPDEKPITLKLKSSKFVCQFPNCSKVCNTIDLINSHMALHSDFCPWRCGLCKYTCKFKSDLRVHLKQGHDEVEFQCTKCIKSFKSKLNLNTHIANVHESKGQGEHKKHKAASQQVQLFKCKKCPEQFTSDKLLVRHESTAHIIILEARSIQSKPKFKCPVCNINMTGIENLRIHMTSLHNVNPSICTRDNCNIVFKSKLNLNTHIADVHESNQEKDQVQNHTTEATSNKPNSARDANLSKVSNTKNNTLPLEEEFILPDVEENDDNYQNHGEKRIDVDFNNVIQIRVIENQK